MLSDLIIRVCEETMGFMSWKYPLHWEEVGECHRLQGARLYPVLIVYCDCHV